MFASFTPHNLQALLPRNKEVSVWYTILFDTLPKYKIDNPQRVAGFISQCAHESTEFTVLEENLQYSATRLEQVFPRYFGIGKERATVYAYNPEKLANYVYADKNRTKAGALGNVNPGDGWLFRGRGIKQLTGRNNYTEFGVSVGMTAEQAAEYVATKQGAVESACWFWDKNKLNLLADAGDVVGMTKRINGGTIGLEDRQRRFTHAIHVFSDVLQLGTRSDTVKLLQKALNLQADGIFGPKTKQTVTEWQAAHGFTPNGVVTSEQLSKLLKG